MMRINSPVCILIWALSACPVILASCGGGGGNDSRPEPSINGKDISRDTDAPPSTLTSPSNVAKGTSAEEIIPLFNPIPPGLAEDRVLPEDPAAFRRLLMETIKKDPSADVLSMIDVVLLLDPSDTEIREIRAKMLMKQGFQEDAAVDFDQCCKGGRPSCCR